MHGHCPGDRPAALAGVEALEGLGLLVVRDLAAAAVVGPLDDALALIRGHGGQDEAAGERGGDSKLAVSRSSSLLLSIQLARVLSEAFGIPVATSQVVLVLNFLWAASGSSYSRRLLQTPGS